MFHDQEYEVGWTLRFKQLYKLGNSFQHAVVGPRSVFRVPLFAQSVPSLEHMRNS